jgi:hypothetical protein
MQKLHLGLAQQLGQLETRQDQIGDAIAEVNRRIAIIDEVISWSMPEGESQQEYSHEPPSQEVALYEELPAVEMVREEIPQEEMFQEELTEELAQEVSSEVSSEEESTEEEVSQGDEFRQLDTEGTEIQWVNR